MFPSLQARSWLDIALGFLFGAISTIFVITVLNQLKKSKSAASLISARLLYSLSMAVASLLYACALSGGLLVEWQRLHFPRMSERAVRVPASGYIEEKSGNIYNDNQGNLERVDAVPQSDSSFPVVSTLNNCGALFLADPQTGCYRLAISLSRIRVYRRESSICNRQPWTSLFMAT